MTNLEKTVEALRRCIPAAAFEKALAEVEGVEATKPGADVADVIRDLLTEMGTPDHLMGHRYIVTAVQLVVENPDYIYHVTKALYIDTAKTWNTTPSRVERAIRHAIETTWNRIDYDVAACYFGSTVDPDKGRPVNSEFLARMGNIVRRKIKEVQR